MKTKLILIMVSIGSLCSLSQSLFALDPVKRQMLVDQAITEITDMLEKSKAIIDNAKKATVNKDEALKKARETANKLVLDQKTKIDTIISQLPSYDQEPLKMALLQQMLQAETYIAFNEYTDLLDKYKPAVQAKNEGWIKWFSDNIKKTFGYEPKPETKAVDLANEIKSLQEKIAEKESEFKAIEEEFEKTQKARFQAAGDERLGEATKKLLFEVIHNTYLNYFGGGNCNTYPQDCAYAKSMAEYYKEDKYHDVLKAYIENLIEHAASLQAINAKQKPTQKEILELILYRLPTKEIKLD